MEELLQAVDIPFPPKEDGSQSNTTDIAATMLIGSVKLIHVRKDMLNERGVCDMSKLKVVGRIFGIAYSRLTEGYEMERPRWQDVEGKF